MAWRLSGNPLPVFMSWEKKALMLRTIVLSIPALQTMSESSLEMFDAMRSFNRGTITFDELREIQARIGPVVPNTGTLHEPLDFHGWTVDVTLIDKAGAAWWLGHVTRRTRNVTDGDKRWLYKVLGMIGCDPEADRVSISPLEDLVREAIPCCYMWPNTFDRLEVHLSDDKKGTMQIVQRGTRPVQGFQRLDDVKVDD